MLNIGADTLAMLIPIIAVLGGIVIAIFGVITKGKEEELRYKERILAMEKGIPVPEIPKEEKRPSRSKMRTWGVVLTLVGIAIIVATTVRGGLGVGIWGVLPIAIGVGLLISAALDKADAQGR